MLEILPSLLAGAALITANAFFVVTEFALTRLRQFSPEEIRRSWTEGEGGREAEDPERADGAARGPITSFLEMRQRLRGLLNRGELDPERRREILKALEIQEIPVREIMVPREDVMALSTDAVEAIAGELRDPFD